MRSAFVRLAISLLIGLESFLVEGSSKRRVREVRTRRYPRSSNELPCVNQTSCRYVMAMLDFPPYVMNKTLTTERGFLYDQVIWFVETACLDMNSFEDPPACCVEPLFVKTSEDLIKRIKDKEVDLAFPIQADVMEQLKGISHVTLIRAYVANGCSLIVNTKQCEAESREQLLTSITSQWPILACIILLSGISGVTIWLLEHRANEGQFASSFTAGSPEGFWWAVVSLTTVGYGDKTPTTFLGRMFGVIWILVGAIMLSLFTALFTNAMQAALDGTKCLDISSKDVGVSIMNTEAQRVAKDYDAHIVKFDSIAEMQENISTGAIGRVLVDRNTAFHFLDDSRLKRNRQIRLIRNIEYPMDYFVVHVDRTSEAAASAEQEMHEPLMSLDLNDTDRAEDLDKEQPDPMDQWGKVASCGPLLKQLSSDLVGATKQSAQQQVIPAALQTASLSDEMEGLFSTESQMTSFMLFCLLGVLLSLLFIGILWEVFTKCSAPLQDKKRRLKGSPSLRRYSDKGNLIPLNKKFNIMQSFLEMEERLKDFTTDFQKMKEEFASTIANGDMMRGQHRHWSDDMNSPEKGRSFFDALNGKSKNPEAML